MMTNKEAILTAALKRIRNRDSDDHSPAKIAKDALNAAEELPTVAASPSVQGESISDDIGFAEALGAFLQDVHAKPYAMDLTRYIDQWHRARLARTAAPSDEVQRAHAQLDKMCVADLDGGKPATLEVRIAELYSWYENTMSRDAAPGEGLVIPADNAVIQLLLEVVRCAWTAMDNTEDDGNGKHWNEPDFDALSNAMDAFDALPDDRPGYVMGPAAKAEWALRAAALVAEAPILPPMPKAMYKHPKLGDMFDRLQMHFYAARHAEGLARLYDIAVADRAPATEQAKPKTIKGKLREACDPEDFGVPAQWARSAANYAEWRIAQAKPELAGFDAGSERGVDCIMAAMQCFADEWAAIGNGFGKRVQAENTKARIRRMLEDDARAILAAQPVPQASGERDAVQVDAARYRYLRNVPEQDLGKGGQPCIAMPNGMSGGYYMTEENADFAVDASIAEAVEARGAATTSKPEGGQ